MQPQQTTTLQPVTVITKVQQPWGPSSSSAQPTFYVVVDDQQPGTSRQMIFNPPSVATSQQESQHNTSGLSSLFTAIPSVLTYQQMDTPQPFSPPTLPPAPSTMPSSTHQEESRPPSQSSQQSQNQLKSADQPAQVAPNPTLLRATRNVQKQLTSYMFVPKKQLTSYMFVSKTMKIGTKKMEQEKRMKEKEHQKAKPSPKNITKRKKTEENLEKSKFFLYQRNIP